MYLCLIFKPQYAPFIIQGLFVIYVMNRFCRTISRKVLLGLLVIFCNAVLFIFGERCG